MKKILVVDVQRQAWNDEKIILQSEEIDVVLHIKNPEFHGRIMKGQEHEIPSLEDMIASIVLMADSDGIHAIREAEVNAESETSDEDLSFEDESATDSVPEVTVSFDTGIVPTAPAVSIDTDVVVPDVNKSTKKKSSAKPRRKRD